MTRKLIFAAVLVLAGSAVLAQPTSDAPPDVDMSLRQRAQLTPAEMLTQGRDHQEKMNETLKKVQALQEGARKQKDIIKLNCVTDKLIQAKININIGDQAMASLQEAIARNDEEARLYEFTRLTIVNQKVQVLYAEAENCVGEDLTFVGSTKVDTDIDPNLPEDDPSQPWPARPAFERPPAVSPWR